MSQPRVQDVGLVGGWMGELPHIPVLLDEVMASVQVRSGGVYVDGTIGGGGYSSAILHALAGSGRLIGLDLDQEAVDRARCRFSADHPNAEFVSSNFAHVAEVLKERAISAVDGIVVDIGLSSIQLDDPHRGFSFQNEGPLDMRMDRTQAQTAESLIHDLSEEALADCFYHYGEERFSRRIAKAIVTTRHTQRITTTKALAQIIWEAVPPPARRGRIHPATRVFQALRIMVNGELANLERFLNEAPDCLAPGGRLAVVSFHSLEDRLVKRAFRGRSADNDTFRELTRKPVIAGEAEISRNPRSRSAKLRALERL